MNPGINVLAKGPIMGPNEEEKDNSGRAFEKDIDELYDIPEEENSDDGEDE